MSFLLMYVIKVSVCLAIVQLFYRIVLQKLTFYNWNRWYLLAYTALSFYMPFVDISPVLNNNKWQALDIVQWVPVISEPSIQSSGGPSVEAHNTQGGLLVWFFLVGILVMLIRLCIQMLSFRKMMRTARFLSVNGMKVFHTEEKIIPFSFGNSIFINPSLHDPKELNKIILHEFIHVKQKHSIDIIWGEILCVFNWFNPFAWMLKNSMRENLEFIADNKVLANGVNRKDYQYLLLKVMGNNQFSVTAKFNFSSLKKRIIMMDKLRSTKVNLLRFLFIMPVLALLLLSFRKHINQPEVSLFRAVAGENTGEEKVSAENEQINRKTSIDTNVTLRIAPGYTGKPQWASILDGYEVGPTRATMHLKNGVTEVYDLTDSVKKKEFTQKFGQLLSTYPAEAGPYKSKKSMDGKTLVMPMLPVLVSRDTIIPGKKNSLADNGKTNPGSNIKNATYSYGRTMSGDEDVQITITKKATRSDLDKLKNQLKEKGIEIIFDKIDYSADGILTGVHGMMMNPDGYTRFDGDSFGRLLLAMERIKGVTYLKVQKDI